MHVLIRGAGVAGLALAHTLARGETRITVSDVRRDPSGGASWLAGGMLAPWCERASAEPEVLALGRMAADWWDSALPGHVRRGGTLVVAPPRDRAELSRFAARTEGYEWRDGAGIAALEPDLAERFAQALFFPGEAHLDPHRALTALRERLAAAGVAFRLADEAPGDADIVADCTGIASSDPELRGVRGEMLILHAPDVTLSRPVRLLHPRIPVYVVPRGGGRFMVGATMIESADRGPVSVRSMMELLNAAYSLHPGFAEASIVETGVGVRPAYADNLPRVRHRGNELAINGLYRHGFLLAPAMAQRAATLILHNRTEALHEADG